MKQFNLQGRASLPRLLEIVIAVAMPLLLAVIEVFHPHPHDLLNLDVHTWMMIHTHRFPSFRFRNWL
jgi:hypothetical protein